MNQKLHYFLFTQTFITWCLAAAALHSAASQSPGRPPLAPPPGTRGPFSPQDTEGGRDLLSEGLSIPLLWGSPASIQIPALMLLTVVLLFFTGIAYYSVNSDGFDYVNIDDKRMGIVLCTDMRCILIDSGGA